MQKKPEILTFDRFTEILSPNADSIPDMLYMSRDLMVGLNLLELAKRINQSNLFLQVQDYRFGFVCSGHLKVRINLIDKEIKQGCLLFITPSTILQPLEASKDFAVRGMALSAEELHLATNGRLPSFIDGKQMDGQLPADNKEIKLLTDMYALLLKMIQKKQPNRQGQLAIISAILSEFDLMFSSQEQHHSQRPTYEQSRFNRFIYLVNKHSKEEHQLSFYADKMCLSERYLGSMIKKTSGITAKGWIDRSLITTAKVMLKYSDKTSTQIADELNFPNASFFTKYFKRLTGSTPLEYRKEN